MRTELVLPLPRGDLSDLLHLHQKGQRPAKGPVSEHHSQAGPACLSGILAQGTAVAMHDTAFGCWEPSSDRQALPPRASVLVDKDRRDRQSASWSTGADSCHVAQGPQVPPPYPWPHVCSCRGHRRDDTGQPGQALGMMHASQAGEGQAPVWLRWTDVCSGAAHRLGDRAAAAPVTHWPVVGSVSSPCT